MFPASLIADCSRSPSSVDVPAGRRNMSSESLTAVCFGNTRSVRPVRSPIMFMSTAAPGSSGPVICGGPSSSFAIVIVGTLIMIVLPVICDSAVAACPAPMFATSRNASTWTGFRVFRSFIPAPLEETAHVEDERRHPVTEDRRPAEHGKTVPHRVERLDDDLLLARQFVHHQPGAPVGYLQYDDLPSLSVAPRQADDVAEMQDRQHVVAENEHLSTLHVANRVGLDVYRLVDVRHRNCVRLVTEPREPRAHDGGGDG